MKEEEVLKFVSEAVEYVETNHSIQDLPKERAKLASFLRNEFNIAIKDLQINMKDGNPYLIIEYFDDENQIKETKLNVKKWENNFK